jgi:protein ImuB
MSLSLPRWPVERRSLRPSPAGRPASPDEPAGAPFALVHTTTGGERLYALDNEAARLGLRRGQALADAKALEPGLRIAPSAPDADRRLLGAFARWCGRWSPWTAPDPGAPGEDGIWLDITGCAHLFGGEDRMIASALEAVRGQGLTAHGAIAPTLGLAWGLARFPARRQAAGWLIADDIPGSLHGLPVEALRIGETAAHLRRFGLKRVGDIAGLPRANLARRFGTDLVRRLDQARGQAEETLNPLQPKTPFRSRLRFADPLLMLEGIKQAVRETALMLCEQLEGEGRGLRRVELNLFRVDGKTHLLIIGTAAPARDAAHIARLFNEKLDRAEIDIGFGIDVIELNATETSRVAGRQAGLIGDDRLDTEDFARLTDRLSVRLGENRVKRAGRRESHIPDRAAGWRAGPALAVGDNVRQQAFLIAPDPDRPLLILARPEPAEAVAEIPDGPPRSFVWRRTRHQVHQAEGPERLAPEWWRPEGRDHPRTRDYFRVETQEGRRFWLYRDGLFGLETQNPQWFVHGAS